MAKKKIIHTVYKKHFDFSKKEMGLFFLGVGLTMFVLNIASMLNMIEYLVVLSKVVEFPFLGFYISTLASVLLMAYALLNINSEE